MIRQFVSFSAESGKLNTLLKRRRQRLKLALRKDKDVFNWLNLKEADSWKVSKRYWEIISTCCGCRIKYLPAPIKEDKCSTYISDLYSSNFSTELTSIPLASLIHPTAVVGPPSKKGMI